MSRVGKKAALVRVLYPVSPEVSQRVEEVIEAAFNALTPRG